MLQLSKNIYSWCFLNRFLCCHTALSTYVYSLQREQYSSHSCSIVVKTTLLKMVFKLLCNCKTHGCLLVVYNKYLGLLCTCFVPSRSLSYRRCIVIWIDAVSDKLLFQVAWQSVRHDYLSTEVEMILIIAAQQRIYLGVIQLLGQDL